MKLLRLTALIVFLLSSAAFSFYRIYKVNNIDTAGPEITFPTDAIYTEVSSSADTLLNDVTAYDEQDGDVTESIIIENISKFISPGKCIITYVAFDGSNNMTKKERYLIFTDYAPPRFSLSKPLVFNVGEYTDIIDHMKAVDCIDGDLSNNIRYEREYNDNFGMIEGEYEVKFWVTNSYGDSSYLPVRVSYQYISNEAIRKTPLITIEDYIVYIKKGTKFDPSLYPKGFSLGNNSYLFREQDSIFINGKRISKDMINIYSNVNVNKPGIYYCDYLLTIYEGYEGKTRLIVVVEQTAD